VVLVTNAIFYGNDNTYGAQVVVATVGGVHFAIALGSQAGAGDFNLSIVAQQLTNAVPRLDRIFRLPDGSCQLAFRTGGNSHWRLEHSANLAAWQVGGLVLLPNTRYDFTDVFGMGASHFFYRLRSGP
jgi:hypothetical protein